ncbi:MAG: hypothetical protein LBR60_01710, partial [Fibrobacter sp.]|nr:hypothetical protein [Fibrobacter sp.]
RERGTRAVIRRGTIRSPDGRGLCSCHDKSGMKDAATWWENFLGRKLLQFVPKRWNRANIA